MKIGTLTFHAGPNHGGFLQAFSLVHFLRSRGHDAEVINYKNKTLADTEAFKPWVYRRPHSLWHNFLKRRAMRRDRPLLPCSPAVSSTEDIDFEGYDAIIVGSDVVWNFESTGFGRDPVYAGVFPRPFTGKLISYAPSIGGMDVNFNPGDSIRDALKRFTNLSSRDEPTRRWLMNFADANSEIVVDPTWLSGCSALSSPCTGITEQDIVVYSYHMTPDMRMEIMRFARSKGMRTVATGYQHRWCDTNRLDLSPTQWVAAIRGAGLVVTGTLHGTLFAIRERKPFVVISEARMLAKTVYWLKKLELLERLSLRSDQFSALANEPVNWQRASETYAESVASSEQFLDSSLKG